MEERNHIKVVIFGEVYELTSSESQEHVENVAAYIDNKLTEIYSKKSYEYINHRLKTLFVSLNIADDLFKEKKKVEALELEKKELTIKLDSYIRENAKLSEENKLLLENITYLQEELSKAKRELLEYIETFEK